MRQLRGVFSAQCRRIKIAISIGIFVLGIYQVDTNIIGGIVVIAFYLLRSGKLGLGKQWTFG